MGGLREILEADILGWPDVAVKKMFGCPGYRRGGVLFAFLRDDALVLMLPPEQRVRWSKTLGGSPFTYPSPKGDMVMAKWLQIPYADEGDLERLLPAIRAAYDAASDAGAKASAPRKAKAPAIKNRTTAPARRQKSSAAVTSAAERRRPSRAR